MLRLARAQGQVLVVSRVARAPAVGVVVALLLAGAALSRGTPVLAGSLGLGAVLVVLLGGRAMRARFERGRVSVHHPFPFRPADVRPLSDFSAARVETVGEARRRKAARLAHGYRARSGGAELPSWMQPPVAPGVNDHLRRVVLVGRGDEPLPVTEWVADPELEAVRSELQALLG